MKEIVRPTALNIPGLEKMRGIWSIIKCNRMLVIALLFNHTILSWFYIPDIFILIGNFYFFTYKYDNQRVCHISEDQ